MDVEDESYCSKKVKKGKCADEEETCALSCGYCGGTPPPPPLPLEPRPPPPPPPLPACELAAGMIDTRLLYDSNCGYFDGDEGSCTNAITSVADDLSTFKFCYYSNKGKC